MLRRRPESVSLPKGFLNDDVKNRVKRKRFNYVKITVWMDKRIKNLFVVLIMCNGPWQLIKMQILCNSFLKSVNFYKTHTRARTHGRPCVVPLSCAGRSLQINCSSTVSLYVGLFVCLSFTRLVLTFFSSWHMSLWNIHVFFYLLRTVVYFSSFWNKNTRENV